MGEISKLNLFDVLDFESRSKLVKSSRTVRFRKGQTIIALGDNSTDLVFIQEGKVQAVLYADSGREVSLRELGPDQIFGELGAIDGGARSAAVVGLTGGRLMLIESSAFRSILRENVAASEWLITRLASQVRNLTARVFELSALNVRARLHCELVRIAHSSKDLNEPAPTHSELANRIGTHREAVTRELNDLADRNIIRVGRRKLEFVNLLELEKEAITMHRATTANDGWW